MHLSFTGSTARDSNSAAVRNAQSCSNIAKALKEKEMLQSELNIVVNRNSRLEQELRLAMDRNARTESDLTTVHEELKQVIEREGDSDRTVREEKGRHTDRQKVHAGK